jgi:CDGSH-type Zn-finger protein/uncharacterized Fe-S cluster protein YjdI
MTERERRYFSLEIVVDYAADRCIHAAECLRGLPSVFDTGRRPWVLPSAASPDDIAAVIQRCPSGALHFVRSDGREPEPVPEENTIVPRPNGSLYVHGQLQLRREDGSATEEDTRMTLCRCGRSRNKPFCDNSHRASGFRASGVVENGGSATKTGLNLLITPIPNGPLLVEGPLRLESADGSGRFFTKRVELCRCGASRNKPFCDGTHESIGFRSA